MSSLMKLEYNQKLSYLSICTTSWESKKEIKKYHKWQDSGFAKDFVQASVYVLFILLSVFKNGL